MKGVYAVIKHTFKPLPRSDKVEVYEKCEFIDYLKYKHYTESTGIVDIKNRKLIKDRSGTGSFDSYIAHIMESYPKEFKNLLQVTDLEEAYESEVAADSIIGAIDEAVKLKDEAEATQSEVSTEDGETDEQA